MKKAKLFLPALLGLLALASCNELFDMPAMTGEPEAVAVDRGAPSFTAGFGRENLDTRTYIGDGNNLYWTADDRVSVFNATTDNLEYVFCGSTGDSEGVLSKVLDDKTQQGDGLSTNYAVYPYSEQTSISEDGVITYDFPSVQTFSNGTFGLKSNTMVAVTGSATDRNFNFRNVGGYLVLNLYGDMTVASVTVTSTAGEKLSGTGDISISGGIPSVAMHQDASASLTLDCGQGVKLSDSADNAREFWIVLPPVTFSKGFTVTVTGTDGRTFAKSRITSGTISRNGVIRVNPFAVTTRAGRFVRLSRDEETIDKAKVKELIADYGVDISQYESVVDIVYSLIDKNGTIMLDRVIYTTTDRNGNVVEASGLISYPKKLKGYSKILSVQHGTCDIDEAPSYEDAPYEMMAAYREGVQIATMADYPGYGASRTADLQTPFMHSSLTGTACADLIEAAQDFLASQKGWTASNPTISLIGFSQGAAASISTLQELERRNPSVKIGDVSVGGGPYDICAFLNHFIENADQPFTRTGFIAYSMRGLIYGDRLNLNERNIYAPYIFDKGIYGRFSTTYVNSWHNLIGSDVKNVFHPDFFAGEGFNANADIIKLFESAERNSTINYDGPNKSKIKIYHSKTDDTIPYAISEAAAKKWNRSLTTLEKDAHVTSGIEFYLKYVIEYYDASSWLEKLALETFWSIVKNLF